MSLAALRLRPGRGILERFAAVVPPGPKVTVLAGRGFGDQALYGLLEDRGPASRAGCSSLPIGVARIRSNVRHRTQEQPWKSYARRLHVLEIA